MALAQKLAQTVAEKLDEALNKVRAQVRLRLIQEAESWVEDALTSTTEDPKTPVAELRAAAVLRARTAEGGNFERNKPSYFTARLTAHMTDPAVVDAVVADVMRNAAARLEGDISVDIDQRIARLTAGAAGCLFQSQRCN